MKYVEFVMISLKSMKPIEFDMISWQSDEFDRNAFKPYEKA